MKIHVEGTREEACRLARRLGRTLARPATEEELDAARARLKLVRIRRVREEAHDAR